MLIAVEVPNELYDDTAPVPFVCTPDGEMLARADEVPAGAWLASVLESVDVTRLTAFDLPNYLRAAARVEAWAASLKDTAIAELASRPDRRGAAADAEVSFVLREPIALAQRRIHRALRLRAFLPLVKRAFSHGDVSEFQVEQLVAATNQCDDSELLEQVQTAALRMAGEKTGSELRRYARRMLDRLDPHGVTRRAKAARAEADVTFHPGEDGMAGVVADLPVEDAMIVKAAADAYAIRAKQTGDDRRIGVLRGEGLTRLCADYLTGTGTGTVGGSAPRSGGRPVEIGIVIGLRTALGLDDLPGEVPAAGIVPRDVIAAMVATELPRLRLMVIDDDPTSPTAGRLVYRGVDSYRPTAEQVAHVRAVYPMSLGPGSQVRADRCDTEHFTPWPDGQTIVTNLGPFDRTWHNRKTRGSLSVTVDDSRTVTLTTTLGQSRTVTPYDYSPPATGRAEAGTAVQDDDPAPF
jgi:hypothetical protein